MDELFHCNYKRCKVILNTTAWIGSCSHIFCDDHCPYGGVCPLCSSALNTKYGLIETNLNPSEEKKSMILAGFIPTKILNIGGKALEFWKFQLIQDKMYSISKVHYLQSRQAQGKSSYEAMTQRLNSCIEEQAQKYEEIQNKMIIYIKRTQELEKKIKIKNQQLMNAHMHLESLRNQQPVEDTYPIKGTPSSSRQFRESSYSQRRMCENHPNEVTTFGTKPFRASSVGPRRVQGSHTNEVTTSTSKPFRASSVGPRRVRDNHPHVVNTSGSRASREDPRRVSPQVSSSQQPLGSNLFHPLLNKHHTRSHELSRVFPQFF